MDAITTRVEIVSNRLSELALALGAKADVVLAEGAYEIEAQAKARAPVDTGALRASIQTTKDGPARYIVAVGAEYGIYQEFGTYKMAAHPYLIPAFEAVEPKIVAKLEGMIR